MNAVAKAGLTTGSTPARFGNRSSSALLLLLALAVIALLSPWLPWLTAWPDSLTLPVTGWIGQGLEALLGALKPLARAAAVLFGYQMSAANALLTQVPWLAVVVAITALGAWAGGAKLALLAMVGLGFVLASGYWIESMNTLALVAVSVPLALSMGMAIGLLAFEIPSVRRAVEAILDVMQTVPTFAYLTPLLVLFGFGPVVGLIASAIYAAPPMARNVLLGLDRVDAEVREAGIMSGATRFQQLLYVELPAASTQIMVGVNQCIMAALSMAIIAAVIGGFDDISWEILLTMRKAQFGQSLLAGFVIVIFAMLIDRISGAFAETTIRERHGKKIALAAGIGIALAVLISPWLPAPGTLGIMAPVSEAIDRSLGSFTADYGAVFDSIKNGAMFFLLLPVRIGLDDAVLPFTWGFSWTPVMSYVMAAVAAVLALFLVWRGRMVAAVAVVCVFGILHSGLTQVPWLAVISVVAAIGWAAGGRPLALFAAIALAAILLAGLWERAMLSLYLTGVSVFACAIIGGALGTLAAFSPIAWRILRPICDMLQTIPLFVFLIPVLMLFQIGEFTAFIAICLYAVVPMIRYTRHGLVTTPPDLLEAATASGATPIQILQDVRIPYALPTILLGLNQTILYAFAMLVIAALVGTTGLGQSIYLALGQADVGLGIAAGAAMALLALVTDRLIQGFAEKRRKALDLG
ncbi:MAG: ABC transporter permease [Geminicoccaceae bacterium]